MKARIEELYKIKINSIITISNKAKKLVGENDTYILKFHDDQALENIFGRLAMLHIDTFLLPLKSINDRYIEYFEEKYFSLSIYLKDENTLAKDVRLSFYIKAIANLHQKTIYNIKINDGYLEESLNYLDNKIAEVKNALLARIERVERMDYHSPADWFFMMNYDHLMKAVKEAERRVVNLESEWNNSDSLHLCLTYQNFDFSHILVKQQKIVSLDKMALAPAIYDLINLVDVSYELKFEISFLLKEYLSIYSLAPYEVEWLLAYLFIPKIIRMREDIDDIENLTQALNHLRLVEDLTTKLLALTSAEKQKSE